jgi:hypothetical protein
MVRKMAMKVLVLLLVPALLVACNPFGLRDLLKAATRSVLSIDPRNVTMPAGASLTFTANGGIPGYTYSVTGDGTIDADTGEYTALPSAGTATIRVTDAAGAWVETGVTINDLVTGLYLSPSSIEITVNGRVDFEAIGGLGTYAFSIPTPNSGTPSIVGDVTTGHYTAGGTPGTDIVEVTDGVDTATATVTVVALSSTVDYTVTGSTFPTVGTAGEAIPAGYDFTVENVGAGNGNEDVSWKVYLSTDATLGGGDLVVAEGTALKLDSLTSEAVTLSGTYPSAAAGSYRLIVSIDALDDTTTANNAYVAPATFTLDPKPVDYIVPTVSHSSGTVAGSAVSGSFTLRNQSLTADGSATVYWRAYASADTNAGANDFLLQAGSRAALAANTTTSAIAFSGTWPTTPGDWYLVVEVSAADDIDSANDAGATVAPVTVTGAAPLNIDYIVVEPITNSGTIVGYPHTGTFTVKNQGTVGGSQTVHWTAYRSSNASLDVATDTVIDSGTTSFLGAGATSATITFDGTWPSPAATWYLFVVVSAADDKISTNNESAAFAVPTAPPDVNYKMISVASTGGTKAGGQLDGSFMVQNTGSDAGGYDFTWIAYLSTDGSFTPATDPVIDSGVASPLASLADTTITFSSTWPSATSSKNYWLFVAVVAADDINSADDTADSGSVTVTPPDVNYDIISVSNTGALLAGGPLAGSFELKNIGATAGSQTVYWSVYRSDNTAYNAGVDPLIDAGSVVGGLGGSVSAYPIFAGTWPDSAVSQTYYYIVRISASDDTTSSNDQEVSIGYVVAPPAVFPDYTVTAGSVQTTGTVGAAISTPNTFQVLNTTLNPGTKTLTWRVYASRDVILDGADTQIATGTTPALVGGGNSGNISFGGTWPSFGAYYHLIVSLDADDDSNPSNDTWVSAAIEVPTLYLESNGPANNGDAGPIPPAISNYYDLALSLQPGQLVRVDGTMDAKFYLDTYKLTLAATTTSLHIALKWATASNACDWFLWDESGNTGSSSDTTNNIEESTFIGLTPLGPYYVGVYFLENHTGVAYQLYIEGKP